jgi:hypothetical protein
VQGEGEGKMARTPAAAAAGSAVGMEMPIMHDGDRYEPVRDIGSGNFGVARLMRNRATGDLVAVKYIDRGDKVRFVPYYPFFLLCKAGRRLVLMSCAGVGVAVAVADRRERAAGDHQPPLAAPPQHHPLQGGEAEAGGQAAITHPPTLFLSRPS